MFGEVEYFIPEVPQSILWSKHNQIAICTPKLIHLLSPEWGEGGNLTFRRGGIRAEYVSSGTDLELSQAYWWVRVPLSVLVIISRSKRIYFLECTNIDMCVERSWSHLTEYNDEFSNEPVVCAATDNTGNLVVIQENGVIIRFGIITERSKVGLREDECVTKAAIVNNEVLIVSSLGRIMVHVGSGKWKSILDDGVLLPGPIVSLPDGNVLIAKFNRLYVLNMHNFLITLSITVPDLRQPIVGIIPTEGINCVFILGMDGSCFCLNKDVISKVTVLPWSDTADLITDDAEVAGTSENGDEVMLGKRVCFNGVALAENLTAAWIAETHKHPYPRPSRSVFHYYNFYDRNDSDISSCSDQNAFIRRLPISLTPNERLDHPINCPLCRSALQRSSTNPSVFTCTEGHVFNICITSGRIIEDLSRSLRCNRCHGVVHKDHLDGTTVCPICGGALLKQFHTE